MYVRAWHPREAYHKQGFPSDAKLKASESEYVIRYGDVILPADLRGQGIHVSGCGSNVRNVCRAFLGTLPADVSATQPLMHQSIEMWADKWGKNLCNAATQVVMLERTVGDGQFSRHFMLMARATFSPKYSLWVRCGWSDCNVSQSGGPLEFPFELDIRGVPSRLCPAKIRVPIVTSDDLALVLSQECAVFPSWSACELVYRMPNVPHLLSMVVTGRGAALPMTKAKAKAALDDELQHMSIIVKHTSFDYVRGRPVCF